MKTPRNSFFLYHQIGTFGYEQIDVLFTVTFQGDFNAQNNEYEILSNYSARCTDEMLGSALMENFGTIMHSTSFLYPYGTAVETDIVQEILS